MRLQVLHLPGPRDEFPFALVVDQVSEDLSLDDVIELLGPFGAGVGARATLVTTTAVEVC